MNNKINIQEILGKTAMKAAIKEIVEAVVDKCAEEAELGEDRKLCNNCNMCHGECIIIDKESILQIKQIVDYGL
jgi:heterodisulfide reductase subunit C